MQLLALAGAVLALVLLAGLAQAAPASAACLDRYLVRPGDSLTGIAARYGFSWRVLARLNNLVEPYPIYAGQWLCLPAVVGAEAAAGTPHPSRRPDFTVRAAGGQVRIQTRNFPARNTYVVRAADDAVPYGYTWHRLGVLRTRTGGELEARYPLPAQLKAVRRLRVCLKNATTDVLTCKVVYNTR